jgi:hypothetical protein
MKKALILMANIVFLAACNSADKNAASPSAINHVMKDSANFTSIQWLDSMHRDFGNITDGEKLEVSFRFKNTGNKPLVITSVQPSCGCTIPEIPREPFAPGAEGFIKATFNSSGHIGTNRKEVYVTANTSPKTLHQLEFTVDVKKL